MQEPIGQLISSFILSPRVSPEKRHQTSVMMQESEAGHCARHSEIDKHPDDRVAAPLFHPTLLSTLLLVRTLFTIGR